MYLFDFKYIIAKKIYKISITFSSFLYIKFRLIAEESERIDLSNIRNKLMLTYHNTIKYINRDVLSIINKYYEIIQKNKLF